MFRLALALSIMVCWLGAAAVVRAQPGAGTFEEVTAFGDNPGGLAMFRYVPSPAPAAGAPVVLALHGCTVSATDFRSTGWEPLADELGFYVVYPQQTSANNPVTCFNWAGEYGDETNLVRGRGENQSIVSMVDKMQADFGTDPSRTFLMGHSAGAAMVMVMLATWPDRFAAAGVIAAIPYRCATSVSGAFSCQSPGRDQEAEAWAELVRAASPHAGPWPRLSVWHGTSDGIVAPMNQREVVEGWTVLHGIDAAPERTDTIDGHMRSVYGGGAIESWVIEGAGHGTFVDAASGCGAVGAYVLDEHICSARHMAVFFGLTGDGGGGGGGGSGPTARGDAGSGSGWGYPGRDGGSGGSAGWSGGSGGGGGAGGSSGGADEAAPCATCAVGSGPRRGAWALLVPLALLAWRRSRGRG